MQAKEIYTLTITFTPNNLFFNISNKEGNTSLFYSAGSAGFIKLKKKTKILIQSLISKVIRKAKKKKINFFNIHLKSTGKLTKLVLKSLFKTGVNINIFKDVTPISHNGPRKRKKKRR